MIMDNHKVVEIDHVREKLTELLQHDNCPVFMVYSEIWALVDHLLAAGVTVLTADEQQNIYTVQEIEALQDEAYDLGADSVLHNHFGLSWDDAAGLRKEVARLQAATKWIPVTERLPEIGGNYFVVVKHKYDFEKEYSYDTDFAEFTFSDGYIDNCWNTYNDWNEGQHYLHVTHWMPLPEPPKEESQ